MLKFMDDFMINSMHLIMQVDEIFVIVVDQHAGQ